MNELYIQKDILPDDNFIRSIILEKYEELLQENDKLKEEVQNLKYQIRTKKRTKKIFEAINEKPTQLSFNFD